MKKHNFLGLIVFFTIVLAIVCSGCEGKTVKQSQSDLALSKIYKTAQNLGFEGTLTEFIELVKGNDGVGISSLNIDDDGNLLVILSDLTEIPLGKIKGKDGVNGINGTNGKDGVGIKDVYMNDEGNLIILYTDGTEKDLGVIKGDKGDTGEAGAQGDKGDKGDTGETGAQGDKGDKGDVGETGAQGDKGDKGDVGETGAQGDKGDKGDVGETGAQGDKGDPGVGITSMYIGEDGYLYVLFTNSDTAICIGDVQGENGGQGTAGLSAYELYIIYNPEYTKTESAWLEDLVNGNLSKKTFTVTVVCGKNTYSISAKEGEKADFTGIVYERKGYNFLHWESNGKIFNPNTAITKDITVTGVYENAKLEVNHIFNNVETAPVTLDAMTKTRLYINYYPFYSYDLTFISEGGTIVIELFQPNGDKVATESFRANGTPYQSTILNHMAQEGCYIEIEYRCDDEFPLTVTLDIYCGNR